MGSFVHKTEAKIQDSFKVCIGIKQVFKERIATLPVDNAAAVDALIGEFYLCGKFLNIFCVKYSHLKLSSIFILQFTINYMK